MTKYFVVTEKMMLDRENSAVAKYRNSVSTDSYSGSSEYIDREVAMVRAESRKIEVTEVNAGPGDIIYVPGEG